MHDIFVCYSSKDEPQARAVLQHLEANGFKCWISSRDVRPGRNYQDSIVRAIETSSAIVFLFSDFSNKTDEVKKELSLASSFAIPVIPFRLTATKPNSALLYELSTRQWIDAFPDFDAALARVVLSIEETMHPEATAERDGVGPAALDPAPAVSQARPIPGDAAAASRPSAVTIGSEEREAVRALLARHVGPIAKLLVERDAADAMTREQLCEKLALHIRNPADRAAFLRMVRARLAVGS
ncbi:MAG: toll/interleukin-1 receptor domain-containing protein [Hyphomicrobiales bacterium]